jgi:chitinase
MNTRSIIIAACVLALASLAAAGAPQKHQIIGYYPAWKYGDRNTLVTPRVLPYGKYSIINYAFFVPNDDGTIPQTDTLQPNEDRILKGERDSVSGTLAPGTSLAARAHAGGAKVMASIGGWDGSLAFPSLASTAGARARFANACMQLIERYGFDGIDIDWEFPCYKDHRGTPGDKHNFTQLLKSLRDSLDARGSTAGVHYLLTSALPAGREHADDIEMREIEPLLDFFNVMTYDCFGEWSPVSGHNSPLYGTEGGGENGPSMDGAFHLYKDTYGIPAAKINLGAAFYAHTFKNCTAIYTAHGGEDREHFSKQGFFYYEIVARMDEFERHWDDSAKVPYLTGKNFPTLVSYDDERSIGLKAQYVVDNNAAGLIVWEITGDFFEDGHTPLLDAMVAKFSPLTQEH